MMRKDFHRKYDIFFIRKAVLVSVLFSLIIIFFLTLSCSLNSDQTLAPANDTSSDQIEEKPQESGIDENENTGGETKEDTEEVKNGEIAINVYYLDAMGESLVAEARVVSSENKYVDALYELMKLPIDSSLYRLVPDSTKINSIIVEDGLAKVDLSKEFVEDRITSDTEDNLLIYSIVNTLTEFEEVNSVTFFIDGEKLNTLGELDVSAPFFRRSDLIKN
jgi:spore germination protein GerM